MGKTTIIKGIGDVFNDIGHGLSNAGKSIGHGLSDAGKWGVHTAEDTFHWGEKTVKGAGKTLLNFSDNQISKVTDIFNNPTFLIVAGVVLVAIVIIK